MRIITKLLCIVMVMVGITPLTTAQKISYPIVDTGTTAFYDDRGEITAPKSGESFYGQDGQYTINPPKYRDNGDGTVTDLVTGLMWQKDMGDKLAYDEASTKAKKLTLGGYNDWRVPTIKELYSLILFTGESGGTKAGTFYIDTSYFNQPIGDTSKGEREIDAQTWSSTEYVGKTMNNMDTVFGVNFIDGRIKGYPKYDPRTHTAKKMYFRMVRGNTDYGKNNFVDNGDGTITDFATGLMWQKADDGKSRDWEKALAYADTLTLAGYGDWRMPNAKELQSIVDYTRSPQSSNSAALDPVFSISTINDPRGKKNYPYFWTSTTHLEHVLSTSSAVYVAFGEALGQMHGTIMDVHGAGAQRSDPKSGNTSEYPQYKGPQGDLRTVFNYVRCVRSIY